MRNTKIRNLQQQHIERLNEQIEDLKQTISDLEKENEKLKNKGSEIDKLKLQLEKIRNAYSKMLEDAHDMKDRYSALINLVSKERIQFINKSTELINSLTKDEKTISDMRRTTEHKQDSI